MLPLFFVSSMTLTARLSPLAPLLHHPLLPPASLNLLSRSPPRMSVESPAAGKAVAPSGDFTPPPPTSSLAGAIALVAGTTVGAGILALPAKTLAAGIVPTTGTLLASWVYMASSGLLIAEVNVNTLCALERSAVSLSTMTEETLGVAGSRVSSLAYVFIHYTLLVAYMLQGGTLLLELGAALPPLAALPAATAGPPLFAALLGGALLLCPPAVVEKVNAVAVGGVIATFGLLLGLGAQQAPPAAG